MKGYLAILGLTVAGFLGYKAEPSMRYQLTGHSPRETAKKAVAPTPAPADPVESSVPAIDLSKLTQAQLPTQVTLKVATEVADASGLKMKIDPGNRLRLVRLEGEVVVVSPGSSPFEGRVPVEGTDLMEQLAANPPAVVPAPAPIATPAATDTNPTPAPVPEPIPTGPVVQPDPATPTDPPAEPTAVTPTPEPVATPAPAPAPGTRVDVVAVMKAHISGGNIKEFEFKQVQSWTAGPDEVIDGQTYQIGLVNYNAETILGNKQIEAKALIKDGQVVKWIGAKSKIEIK